MFNCIGEIVKQPHHEQQDLCITRAKYRQGRKLTAVKVYTVNDESPHLLIDGVPALGLQDDLKRVARKFGDVLSITIVPSYSKEEFIDTYHIQYLRVQSARHAKRRLDGRSFYGGVLHICYAPELESLAETREKLIQRRKDVACRINGRIPVTRFQNNKEDTNGKFKLNPKKRRLDESSSVCIWKGELQSNDPRVKTGKDVVYGPRLPEGSKYQASSVVATPHYIPMQKNINWSKMAKFIPRQIVIKKEFFLPESRGADLPHLSREADVKDADDLATSTDIHVKEALSKVAVPNTEVKLVRKSNVLNMGETSSSFP